MLKHSCNGWKGSWTLAVPALLSLGVWFQGGGLFVLMRQGERLSCYDIPGARKIVCTETRKPQQL